MQRSTWWPQTFEDWRSPPPRDDGPEFREEIAPAIRDQADWFARQPKCHTLRSYRCEADQTKIKINDGDQAITGLFFPSTEIMPVGVFDYVTFSVFPGFIEISDTPLETLLEHARTVPTLPMDLDSLLEQARALFKVQPWPQPWVDQSGTEIARTIIPAADRLVVDGTEFTRWRICDAYKVVAGARDLVIVTPLCRTTVLVETAELVDPPAFWMKGEHLQAYRGSPVVVVRKGFGTRYLTVGYRELYMIDMDRLVVSDLANAARGHVFG